MLHNDTWCMERNAFSRMVSLLAAWDGKTPEAREPSQPRRQKQVAVMSLSGFMEPKMSIMGMLFGGTSTEEFGAQFGQLMADDRVGGIVIDVDSPGGTVHGTQELSQQIFDARGKGKPIIAVANPWAASAALWVASAADRLVVTPSGEAGSVGVFSGHIDESVALEQEGVKVTVVKSKISPYKAETERHEPLTDEAREHMQQRVDSIAADFVSDLSRNRGVSKDDVRANFGKGRMLSARQAVSAGMVDRVATLGETISQMAAGRIRLGSRASEDRWDYRRVAALKRRAELAGF